MQTIPIRINGALWTEAELKALAAERGIPVPFWVRRELALLAIVARMRAA